MTRLFPLSACPSATKMSPFAATATSLGELKCFGSLPGSPLVPSVISTLPSGLNFTTTWPRMSPFGVRLAATASVTHTLPSLSTSSPCGQMNRPPPKLLRTLPSGLNWTIGSALRVAALVTEPRGILEAFASHDRPDAAAVRIDRHLADGAHRPAVRQLCPAFGDAIRVRKDLRADRQPEERRYRERQRDRVSKPSCMWHGGLLFLSGRGGDYTCAARRFRANHRTIAIGARTSAMNCDVDSRPPNTNPRSASPRKNSITNRAAA